MLLAHRVLPWAAVVAGIDEALSVICSIPEVVIVEARRAIETTSESPQLPEGSPASTARHPPLSATTISLEAK